MVIIEEMLIKNVKYDSIWSRKMAETVMAGMIRINSLIIPKKNDSKELPYDSGLRSAYR